MGLHTSKYITVNNFQMGAMTLLKMQLHSAPIAIGRNILANPALKRIE